jgi:chorismate-pyruvate lyase
MALFLSPLGLAARASASPPLWPDNAVSRLEALASIETLNAELLSHDSATLTLERWCGAHGLATPTVVTAQRVREAESPADDHVRELLQASVSEPVRHRHVRLVCGTHILSEADNYYLPSRLTAEMNRVLDSSDTAFGRAVLDLKFRRVTLSADLLWRPLPPDWETATALPPAGPGVLAMPREVLRHRALLVLPDGTPFSALVETYTSEILAFAPPH